jgi:hypothetical protein
MRNGWWLLAVAVGCGPGAGEISGSFGDHAMTQLKTAYFGGPNILLFADDVGCIDTSWIEKNYGDSAPDDANVDFTALQFTFDGTDVANGSYQLSGVSQARAFGLSKQGETWDALSGRDGTLVISSVDSDAVEGTFDVAFTTGSLNGAFTAEYCRNIDP